MTEIKKCPIFIDNFPVSIITNRRVNWNTISIDMHTRKIITKV